MQESNGNQPEEEQYEENEDEEIDPLAYAELISTNGCEDIPRVISEAFEAKNLIAMREEDLSGPIIKKTKSESIIAKAKLGSPMTFINKKTAQRLQTNKKISKFQQIYLSGRRGNKFGMLQWKNNPPERTIKNCDRIRRLDGAIQFIYNRRRPKSKHHRTHYPNRNCNPTCKRKTQHNQIF